MIDPVEVTYEDVRGLIYQTAYELKRKYGGELDDIVGDANVYFMKAYSSYKPKRANFTTWLKNQIKLRYRTKKRREALRRKFIPPHLSLDQRVHDEDSHTSLHDIIAAKEIKSDFNLKEFCRGLSKDARRVVRTVLDPPPDILMDMLVRERESPTSFRMATRTFFRDSGWTVRRIVAAFQEVQRALCRQGV